MKIADWQPHRRIVIDNKWIAGNTQRDRNNGVTTATVPERALIPKIEILLDNGVTVTIAASRVQYVTDYV